MKNETSFHHVKLTSNTEVDSCKLKYYLVILSMKRAKAQISAQKTEKGGLTKNFRSRCTVSTRLLQQNEAQIITRKNFDGRQPKMGSLMPVNVSRNSDNARINPVNLRNNPGFYTGNAGSAVVSGTETRTNETT